MECVGKMGYFNGRCIFYNIIYISRLVETIEYSICTKKKAYIKCEILQYYYDRL